MQGQEGTLDGNLEGEGSLLALLIPLGNPLVGADALEGLEELLAASELLTTSVDALVVIAVRLPAVLALVGVGETSVEGSYSVQFENQENMSDWLVN